jgi:hypothetical protein
MRWLLGWVFSTTMRNMEHGNFNRQMEFLQYDPLYLTRLEMSLNEIPSSSGMVGSVRFFCWLKLRLKLRKKGSRVGCLNEGCAFILGRPFIFFYSTVRFAVFFLCVRQERGFLPCVFTWKSFFFFGLKFSFPLLFSFFYISFPMRPLSKRWHPECKQFVCLLTCLPTWRSFK